jgi:hypothetical protein
MLARQRGSFSDFVFLGDGAAKTGEIRRVSETAGWNARLQARLPATQNAKARAKHGKTQT